MKIEFKDELPTEPGTYLVKWFSVIVLIQVAFDHFNDLKYFNNGIPMRSVSGLKWSEKIEAV